MAAAAVAYVPLSAGPGPSNPQPVKSGPGVVHVAKVAVGKIQAAIPLGAAGQPPTAEFIEDVVNSATPIDVPEGTYAGKHQGNKPHGQGRLTYKLDTFGFFGDPEDSNCKYKLLNHTGLFEDGVAHGKGQLRVQFTEDGRVVIFEGTWTHGKLKGPGRMILPLTAASRTGSWNEDGSFNDDCCCCQ